MWCEIINFMPINPSTIHPRMILMLSPPIAVRMIGDNIHYAGISDKTVFGFFGNIK